MKVTERKLRKIIRNVILENEGQNSISPTAHAMYKELQRMIGSTPLKTESVGGAINSTLGALGKGLTVTGATMLVAGLLQHAGVDLTAITPENMEALLVFMKKNPSELDALATAAFGAMTMIPGQIFSALSSSSKLR